MPVQTPRLAAQAPFAAQPGQFAAQALFAAQPGQFATQAPFAAQPGPVMTQVQPASQFGTTTRAPFSVQAPTGSRTPQMLPASQFGTAARAPFSVQAPAGSRTPPISQSASPRGPATRAPFGVQGPAGFGTPPIAQYSVRQSPSMELLRAPLPEAQFQEIDVMRGGRVVERDFIQVPMPQSPRTNGLVVRREGSTGDLLQQAAFQEFDVIRGGRAVERDFIQVPMPQSPRTNGQVVRREGSTGDLLQQAQFQEIDVIRGSGVAREFIQVPMPQSPRRNGQVVRREGSTGDLLLQAEVRRRQAAEDRVQDLEGLVARLRQRIAALEGKRQPNDAKQRALDLVEPEDNGMLSDPIDRSICEYLERNPDFPVSVQKVAPNHYVFGDRGTAYVTQRGEHIVVRVGGGFKSLQVFMDERALMVTREAAAALVEKNRE